MTIQSSSDAPAVHVMDRALDAGAAALLVAGAGLFLFARYSLTSLANGTYTVARGTTYVARADVHGAQAELGLWLAAAGVVVALLAAASHWWKERRRESIAL